MSQQQHPRVDPNIWQKFAGDSFTVPKLHSKVYYFPQGHLQHVCPNTQPLDGCRPSILCIVSAVDLLADPETDQVYAKLLLTPVIDGSVVPLEFHNGPDGDQIVSYAKTLTNTDVRSGAVLYIPKAGADSILPALPPLDSRNQSRFQDISVKDVCGVVSQIRHFHRLCPFQHLFTIGWSGFVSKKKLVVGDTVVFVKNSAGNISIGIRRNGKLAAAAKMIEKEVKLAIELAEKKAAFEVVYYPTVGGFDFVVGAKIVEDAMKVNWRCGMRVTHMVKNDDTSKGCSIFNGRISNLSSRSTRPWRMLQVKWDDPHVPENLKQLCPWQVELINSNPPISDIQFPPTKKLRGAQGSVLSTEQNISISHTSSTLNSFKIKNVDIDNCNNKKTRPGSIMLFGKMIQPIERDLYESSDIVGDNSCKRSNETDKTC
ncbi:auxin response factor 17-like [Vicia villosa]|uniref:auxin response factor 17-like n=1 Tax=Vicia villosa TaxID=3911 RepID=UPI00273A88DC|nr:auxin response factor 17-like [Vicia villosa]